MKTRLTATVLALAAAATALALTAGAATATSKSPARTKAPVVTIAMHDPGCHWFTVAGAYKTHLTVSGPTLFRNLDEAGLVFKGPGLSTTLAVGKTLQIAKPGVYRITMVKQASDDNHLVLRVTA